MIQERKTLREDRQVVVLPMLASRRPEGFLSDFMGKGVFSLTSPCCSSDLLLGGGKALKLAIQARFVLIR
jgi:hypothetical protein